MRIDPCPDIDIKTSVHVFVCTAYATVLGLLWAVLLWFVYTQPPLYDILALPLADLTGEPQSR